MTTAEQILIYKIINDIFVCNFIIKHLSYFLKRSGSLLYEYIKIRQSSTFLIKD